jgi:hypothetical protein
LVVVAAAGDLSVMDQASHLIIAKDAVDNDQKF